jgi:hypothetical protein
MIMDLILWKGLNAEVQERSIITIIKNRKQKYINMNPKAPQLNRVCVCKTNKTWLGRGMVCWWSFFLNSI